MNFFYQYFLLVTFQANYTTLFFGRYWETDIGYFTFQSIIRSEKDIKTKECVKSRRPFDFINKTTAETTETQAKQFHQKHV